MRFDELNGTRDSPKPHRNFSHTMCIGRTFLPIHIVCVNLLEASFEEKLGWIWLYRSALGPITVWRALFSLLLATCVWNFTWTLTGGVYYPLTPTAILYDRLLLNRLAELTGDYTDQRFPVCYSRAVYFPLTPTVFSMLFSMTIVWMHLSTVFSTTPTFPVRYSLWQTTLSDEWWLEVGVRWIVRWIVRWTGAMRCRQMNCQMNCQMNRCHVHVTLNVKWLWS